MAQKKNSLVANINRRKKAGTSRPKSRSTVSKKSYGDMKEGWPAEKKTASKKTGARKKAVAKKTAAKKTGARKKTAAKKGARKSS